MHTYLYDTEFWANHCLFAHLQMNTYSFSLSILFQECIIFSLPSSILNFLKRLHFQLSKISLHFFVYNIINTGYPTQILSQ